MLSRFARFIKEETSGFHFRLLLARTLLRPFPIYTANRLRALVLRLAGFAIGPKTEFVGTPTFTGKRGLYGRLRIGSECWFNVDAFFDLSERITIGDRVAVGHQVLILTSSHEVGGAHRRAATWYAKPVSIGNGVWLGARCIIMPGIVVGDGAIVAAGALVNTHVAANTIVAGVPAVVVKRLAESDGSGLPRAHAAYMGAYAEQTSHPSSEQPPTRR